MARRAAVISINLNANTAKLFTELDAAGGRIGDFANKARGAGNATRQSMIEASAVVRAAEGDWDRNNRAVARFLSTTLGLGPVFKALFPIIGLAITVETIGMVANKVYEFFKNVQDAGRKTQTAFRELNAPVQLASDELAVSIIKVNNEIAKLLGNHENTLALVLHEAAVEADKLADSLDKSLKEMNEALAKSDHWYSDILATMTGKGPSLDFGKIFGSGGYEAFRQHIADINNASKESLDLAVKAGDLKGAEAIKQQKVLDLTSAYLTVLHNVNQEIKDAQTRAAGRTVQGRGELAGTYAMPGTDETENLAALQAIRTRMQKESDLVDQNVTFGEATAKKQNIQAGIEAGKGELPFQNKIDQMQAKLKGINEELAHIGDSHFAQVQAQAFLEAGEAIAKINDLLKEMHKHLLLPEEEKAIKTIFGEVAQGEDQKKYQQHIDDTIKKLGNQIEEEQLLQSAIGSGYAATRRAAAEAEVMHVLGAQYDAEKHSYEAERIREQATAALDEKHKTSIEEVVFKLNEQILGERALAAAQALGAEAVRRAALDMKLRELFLTLTGDAYKKAAAAEIEFYGAQRANVNAAELATINTRIQAIQRQTAAVFAGADAERNAALQTKVAEAIRSGASPQVIAAIGTEALKDRQLELTKEVEKTGGGYQAQIDKLNLIIAQAKQIMDAGKGTLETQLALNNATNEHLKILVNESLAMRGARDGVRAFFIEMQEQAKSSAQIIYDALNEALNKTSQNLAKLFTGQAKKGDWGKEFKEIGEQMTESSIKGALQKGLGAIGKAFGIEGKPDGSASNPLWVRVSGGGALTPAPAGGGSIPNLINRGASSALTGIGGFLQKLLGGGGYGTVGIEGGVPGGLSSLDIPGFAGGGDMEAGNPYIVGERGPELIVPQTSGSVIPKGGFGGVVNYNIDARGADLGAQNRIARGIEDSHRSAVATAIVAQHERSMRTPKG